MRFVTTFMTLYSWGLAVAILAFLVLISRFYQEKSGTRSWYEAFLIPMGLFLVGALQYAWNGQDFVGDMAGDSLFFLGGITLIFVTGYLRQLMVGRGK